MTSTSKAAIMLAGALLTAGLPTAASAQGNIKDRVQGAIDAVEMSCAADIGRFCGAVTRGEGRLLLCMQAFDDQLGRRCQFALYRASRNLERALDRVERIADACWAEIEANCANADRIGQCLAEKMPALSPSCRTVVDGVRQTLQNLPAVRGLPVLSSDDEDVGRVVEVVRDGNGKIPGLQIAIGRVRGVGGRTISIDANSFEQLGDKVKLRVTAEALRAVPDASKQ